MSGGGKFLSLSGRGSVFVLSHLLKKNLESRRALNKDPHLRSSPILGEGKKDGRRGLVGGGQADYFGPAPFDFGAMPICHRGQVVVNWAVCGRECERDFGFARRPFLPT